MSTAEIRALVRQLKDIAATLNRAAAEDRHAIYQELGINLTYYPDSKTVLAGAGATGVLMVGVEGGT